MICHKPNRALELLPILTHLKKNLSIDFVIGFPILVNWKSNSYNLILVIIDRLTKKVYYELVKIMINAPDLAEVIINMVIYHYKILELIVMD